VNGEIDSCIITFENILRSNARRSLNAEIVTLARSFWHVARVSSAVMAISIRKEHCRGVPILRNAKGGRELFPRTNQERATYFPDMSDRVLNS
jgi:hypothetical protein